MQQVDRRTVIICAICAGIIFLCIVCTGTTLSVINHNHTYTTIEVLDVKQTTPRTSHVMSEEEFELISSEDSVHFETYEQYVASAASTQFEVQSLQVTADETNMKLYQLADNYFQVYYSQQRVSPIFIMAISNVETPGRADNNLTWSALFPSRIVPVELIDTFCVTDVISNDSWYKALSSEYSTRDRGALQMSPTYGTSNPSINAMMSGTEKDKLEQIDTSSYSGWVSGASSCPGDRFYIPDICMRMTAAMQAQCSFIQSNGYHPESDLQLVAMLAMSHQQSAVWGNKNHNAKVGCWYSGDLAFNWAKTVSSDAVIAALTDYAYTTDACYIDTSTASKIFKNVSSEQWSSYATKEIVCTYPIKVLYAYIKLCQLYTQ